MRCDDVETFIDLAVDGVLPDEAKQRLERHLLRCGRCAHRLKALEVARTMVWQAVPKAEPSPAYLERAQARLQAHFESLFPKTEPPSPTQRLLPFLQDDTTNKSSH
ncbi:Putative zinc-finger [Chthonomonas calidirosea]|uniref:Putative zinc-finger n=1 Tax=Chthonomonas calidirosea (strain DSM 23976 / ICMP 18418 / T49) TaxID=1303518 RepID=S0EZV7_CHTCT|nr:zf-HC2 domain-containing protein [Chthonomonas calidirosea]CCW36105.1 Putative zinc-finger [Chthonomonas calidirosea T49]CEK18325.1 Putative zinc-finger [Chthonomonas calidirosea]